MKPVGCLLSACLFLASLSGCGTARATDEPAGTPEELSYNAREGRALYRHYCAVCHGEQGEGAGFNAYNLDPKPRNLAAAEFQSARSDADLENIIRIGGGAAGLSQAMPPWGRTLNSRQIRALVDYLRALPGLADHEVQGSEAD